MRKLEVRFAKLKKRADVNSQIIANMKANHKKYGGFLIGEKSNYVITNPRTMVIVSGGIYVS